MAEKSQQKNKEKKKPKADPKGKKDVVTRQLKISLGVGDYLKTFTRRQQFSRILDVIDRPRRSTLRR